MPPICLPYFSGSRRTFALATEIATGTGRECRLIDVAAMDDAAWQALDDAPAIVFGSPTYMGGVAGGFAQFLEDAASRWDSGHWRDKIAAGFTVASHPSGDKLMTLMRMSVFAAQMQMIWVGQAETGAPIVPQNPGINRDGAWLGLMARDPARDSGHLLDPQDAETARRFGARIAAACDRWFA